jgi:hypothetical protein
MAGAKLPTLGHIDFDTLKNAYVEQVEEVCTMAGQIYY